MKQWFSRAALAILFAAVMTVSVNPVSANATEAGDALVDVSATEVVESSSGVAPEGYVPENTYLDITPVKGDGEENELPRVLLIEDVNPWDSVANQTILGSITEYDKVTTSEFMNVDLSKYGVVVFANDQPFATYNNYMAFKEYLETFASIGGVIVFGACDAGWSNGNLNGALPGDVTKKTHYVYTNYVADTKHAIVTGILTENTVLTDEELDSNYCSHVSFDEESLPAGSKIILRESNSGRPTLVEYPLGKGRVIASGLTWEHNYVYGGDTVDGRFAAIAMEDMFRYAIRVSSIDVDELHLLKEWRLEKNAHAVIVTKASADLNALEPIQGAVVKIGNEEFTTDENGIVRYTGNPGVQIVSVSAEGYRDNQIYYDVQPQESRIIMLENDKGDGRPYITQVTGKTKKVNNYVDLCSQKINFVERTDDSITITVDGNWNGHEVGKFQVYQDPINGGVGKYIDIQPGKSVTFSPGKVFLPNVVIRVRMVTADGQTSEATQSSILGMLVTKQPNFDKPDVGNGQVLKEGLGTLDWFGSHPVKSDNEIFTKLLTSDMSISSELIPIEISKSHNDDGTVTYKGLIGIASGEMTKTLLGDKSDDEKGIGWQWKELKDQINGYKEAGNPKAYFKSLKNKYGKEWKPAKLKAAVEHEVDVFGYLEFNVSQSGSIIKSEGGVIIDGSANMNIGKTFFAGPVPLYFEFKPGIELGTNFGLKVEDGELEIVFGGFEVALPSITLEGGAGVRGVATAGLQGSGDLKMKFLEKGKGTSGKLEFGGAIHVKVIFVVDYTWNFWNTEIPLWPKNPDAVNVLKESAPVVSVASRDYLKKATGWNTGIDVLTGGIANNAVMTTLQEGVMPDAMPQIKKVGDKYVMLFLQDVAERAIGNHTQLVYSVYENGDWSMPMAVCESETADFFFDSVVVGEQLHVVWQKSSEMVDAEDPEALLDAVAKNSEICMATWNANTNSFSEAIYLTDNDVVDMMPTLAADEEGVSVIWVSNDKNNVMGEEGNYTIQQIDVVNGQTSEAKELQSTETLVTEISAAKTESGVDVIYTTLSKEDTTQLYHISGDKVRRVNKGDNAAGLCYEDGAFLWQADGKIYRYVPEDTWCSVLNDSESNVISASYQYVKSGEKTAIVWSEAKEDGYAIMASVLEGNEWCEPVVLLDGMEDNITFQDVVMLENGEYALIMNTANYSEYGLENTALKYVVIEPNVDIDMQYVDVNAPDWANAEQEFTAYVVNKGDSKVSSAELVVMSDEKEYLRKTVTLNLLPGEETFITESVKLEGVEAVTDLLVMLMAENDMVEENNIQSMTVGQVDVTLDVATYEYGDSLLFVNTISNESNVAANVALKLVENTEDGIVIDVKNLGKVTNEASVQYMYTIDKSKIEFDENGIKNYYFIVEALEKDWITTDNVYRYSVEWFEEVEGDPNGEMEEIAIVQPESVKISQESLRFFGPEDEGVQLQATVYPANASVNNIEWEVKDADIAYVDQEGNVTPLKMGSTSIIAKVTDQIMAEITVTVQKAPLPFVDVKAKEWYYPFVEYAYDNSLMSGKGKNEQGFLFFDPSKDMTRAEFVQTLYNKEGKPEVTYTNKFADVPEGQWFTNAIIWASENNIVAGKGDIFDVNGKITREELATVLYNYAKYYKNYETMGRAEFDGYADAASISGWASKNMQWALYYGIMKGRDEYIAPNDSATRAECATMLKNFVQRYEVK